MGRIGKPHGVRGEVVVENLSEEPNRFAPGARLLVGPDIEAIRELRVERSRPDRGRLLVKFEGVDDREGAEGLRGNLAFVPVSSLGPLDEDSFWEHQLAGIQVFDRRGRLLGRISRVLPRPEQDLWELETDGSTILVPAAKQIVASVDLEANRIVIDPPPGLLDDDAV